MDLEKNIIFWRKKVSNNYKLKPDSEEGINLVPLMNDAYLRESYLRNNYCFCDNIINNTLF